MICLPSGALSCLSPSPTDSGKFLAFDVQDFQVLANQFSTLCLNRLLFCLLFPVFLNSFYFLEIIFLVCVLLDKNQCYTHSQHMTTQPRQHFTFWVSPEAASQNRDAFLKFNVTVVCIFVNIFAQIRLLEQSQKPSSYIYKIRSCMLFRTNPRETSLLAEGIMWHLKKTDNSGIFSQPIQGQFLLKYFVHVASMIFISTS